MARKTTTRTILALTGSLLLAASAASSAGEHDHAYGNSQHHGKSPAKLVRLVRDATRQFIDVNAATRAGYGVFLGCVSGPDHGAMGIHYVNGDFVGDGQIVLEEPEALIYEPKGSERRLVGVEYIVDAETWLAANSGPPVLEGQVFNLVGSPNRYNLPPFFELHVWAWRDSPLGTFADWNDDVSCDNYLGENR